MDNVPNEILTQIVESLNEEPIRTLCCPSPLDTDPFLANLRNVRLVCRGFKVAAADIFGETYFSSREVILEKSSLEALLSIVKHEELRKRLKNLTVNTYQFPAELAKWSSFRKKVLSEVKDRHHNYLNTVNEDGCKPFEGVRILVAYAAYKRFYRNQKKAKATGTYTAMLAQSLEILKQVSMPFDSISISGHDRTPALRYISRQIGLGGVQWFPGMSGLVTEATCMIMQAIYWSRVIFCTLALERCGEEHLLLPTRTLRNLKAENYITELRLELEPQAINGTSAQ
jgi:hypothetical protein